MCIRDRLYPLGDGSAVKLTVSAYFTKSGTPIQGEGLVPDVEVTMADGGPKDPDEQLSVKDDAQLAAALRLLHGE